MGMLSWKTPIIGLLAPAAILPVYAYSQEAAAPEAAQDQMDAKLTIYVECYNRLDGSAHRSINRYASWVKDMNAGPTGKEKVVYGLYQMRASDISSCRAKFSEAHELKPSIALDNFAAEYTKALGELGQVVEEMYPYYDREDYKDDKFAKGRAFHTRFVAQVKQFRAASQKFADELDVENDKRLEAQMAAVEKEQGRKLPYLNMATMHRAKLLVRVVSKESAPLDDITTRLDAYEKAADEMLQFAKTNTTGLPIMWSMYVNHVEAFRKAAKERMRRIRDKTPYDQGEAMMINAGSGWMIGGSQEKVIRAYNDLVGSSNSLK